MVKDVYKLWLYEEENGILWEWLQNNFVHNKTENEIKT